MKKIISVDFDGVIHGYQSGWKGVDVIPDPPVDGAVEWLFEMLMNDELEICIFSARSRDSAGRNAMLCWLRNEFEKVGLDNSMTDRISFPIYKPPAFLTIDDRAMTFSGVFPDIDEIMDFVTWQNQEV
jgi:hypothetical protein